MKKQKTVSTLVGAIIIVAVAAVLFGLVFVYQHFAVKPEVKNSAAGSPSQSQQATAGWKTYKNDKYGFEFQYPQEWSVDESKTTDVEMLLSRNIANEDSEIHLEIVSRTQNINSVQDGINKKISEMKNIVKPATEFKVGSYNGQEAIGSLCTRICTGSPEDIYSLFSIVYFPFNSEVFEIQYIEGINGVGWKTDAKDWRHYDDFKNILSTFKFIDSPEAVDEIKILAPVNTSQFDLKNKTFNAKLYDGKTPVKVITTIATKFYSIDCGEKMDNLTDFYNLNKEWVGYAWLFTIKGELNADKSQIVASKISFKCQ